MPTYSNDPDLFALLFPHFVGKVSPEEQKKLLGKAQDQLFLNYAVKALDKQNQQNTLLSLLLKNSNVPTYSDSAPSSIKQFYKLPEKPIVDPVQTDQVNRFIQQILNAQGKPQGVYFND